MTFQCRLVTDTDSTDDLKWWSCPVKWYSAHWGHIRSTNQPVRVKGRVSVLVRVSIRTSWVVNFTLFRCYRPVIYTRPLRIGKIWCLLYFFHVTVSSGGLHVNILHRLSFIRWNRWKEWTVVVVDLLLVLVLVVVGRGVQHELLLPHSRSRRFLNVLTVLALTTLSGSLFQWRTTLWLKKFLRSSSRLLVVSSLWQWPLML